MCLFSNDVISSRIYVNIKKKKTFVCDPSKIIQAYMKKSDNNDLIFQIYVFASDFFKYTCLLITD